MIIKDFVIKEDKVREDRLPKKIHIGAELILNHSEKHFAVPIRVMYEYDDNGSYLANYKKSVEDFISMCRRYSELYTINPALDKEFKL